jgi:hypothetical protein
MAELAFDKSARSFDVDGRMRVTFSHISKATVNPYLGSEIPDAAALGLDPSKVYMLLRDPVELQKAADSFNNLPLLIQHVAVNASEPRRDLIVGSTGSDARFDAPYLSVSLSVWDAQAIAGIESEDQAELSSAYRYTADMTPGVYEGTEYQGIMRDIVGNHVALVDVGRAGPDVVVQDSDPFHKDPQMKQKQRLIAAKADARKALSGVIAQDADLTTLDKVFDTLAMDAEKDEDKKEDIAEDESDDELYEDDPDAPGKRRKKAVAADAGEGADPDGKAKDLPAKPEVTKAAMDSAIASAVTKATARVKAEMEALHVARKEVAPMVGEVALDSAAAVYKFALDHAGVDVTDVHPSAYRALVKMAGTQKTKPAATLGMDAAAAKTLADRFPNLSRFGH